MARRKYKATEQEVTDYRHDATRKNLPPAAIAAQGKVQEVPKTRYAYDPHLPVMKSLGVPELAAHLRGELSLEAAAEAARRKTRRYAKRQLTWLRHQILGNDRSVVAVETKESLRIDDDLFNKILRKVLTLGA